MPKDCERTPTFHQLGVDWHHVVIQSLILPSHLRKLCHYGRCSAGQLRGSTFALGFITMGSLRHVASCTGSYDVNNAPLPSPPPKKKMVNSQKNTGWSLGTRYRRIRHLLCRIFTQTWSLFQTTRILLQQLYTFFPASRILNENPEYVKKQICYTFPHFL